MRHDADCRPSTASRVHRRAVGEARQPDLGDIGARQPVLDQRPHRIAVAQALAVSRMSKCASSVISPTSSSVAAEPEHAPAGSPHYCRRPARSAHAPRRLPRPPRGSAPVACSIVSPPSVDVAAVGDPRRQLAAGLDVVAADPPQRRAQQRRRLVARARRHRPGGQRRADQARPAPRASRATSRSDRLGQLAIALTLAPALA